MQSFWTNKKVFITGHTGFKGGWLALWLTTLGAEVVGYSLQPPTQPNFYSVVELEKSLNSIIGDVRDYENLYKTMQRCQPEIVFHLAAQPLVRKSYINPLETYETNIMGTANLFEAVRNTDNVRVIVNVTSDKCYENKELTYGYKENDPMGGYDPYSSSKGCAELVTSAFRNSFFNSKDYDKTHKVALASARAGNVIGGGDWAEDRLIPDVIRSIQAKQNIIIRNPNAIRPWQHVLEPLSGYILLAKKLWTNGPKYSEGWNFGPNDESIIPVFAIVQNITRLWGETNISEIDKNPNPHEAQLLKLDISKANNELNWAPVYQIQEALEKTTYWYKEYYSGNKNMQNYSINQISEYMQNTTQTEVKVK